MNYYLFRRSSVLFLTCNRLMSNNVGMNIWFDGKKALVTGAGKGIGRVLAMRLAELGADVIAVSRTSSDLESLKQRSSKIQDICLDIGNWKAARAAIQDIKSVDLLINNAAISRPKELGDITEEEVNEVFDVNVKSIINISQIIAEDMKSRGEGGSIVNVSSTMSEYAAPMSALYSTSKGALRQLTKCMAVEYGPYKIRVNTVCPTVVRTPMVEKFNFFDPENEFANQLRNRTPLRRFCEPLDVVDPILFLLSDKSSMITGVDLFIDGGLCMCYA